MGQNVKKAKKIAHSLQHCTSIAQPMDKCINCPFKQRVQEHWQEWMRQDQPKTPSQSRPHSSPIVRPGSTQAIGKTLQILLDVL